MAALEDAWSSSKRRTTLLHGAARMMTLMSMEYGGLDSVIRERRAHSDP